LGVTGGDVPGENVGVTVRSLGVGGHDDVDPHVQGSLAERGHRGVVGDDDDPDRMCTLYKVCEIAQV